MGLWDYHEGSAFLNGINAPIIEAQSLLPHKDTCSCTYKVPSMKQSTLIWHQIWWYLDSWTSQLPELWETNFSSLRYFAIAIWTETEWEAIVYIWSHRKYVNWFQDRGPRSNFHSNISFWILIPDLSIYKTLTVSKIMSPFCKGSNDRGDSVLDEKGNLKADI
jgi:hypothetical protein